MHSVVDTLAIEAEDKDSRWDWACAQCSASAPVCTAAVLALLVAVLGRWYVSVVDFLYIDLPVALAHALVAELVEPKGVGIVHT